MYFLRLGNAVVSIGYTDNTDLQEVCSPRLANLGIKRDRTRAELIEPRVTPLSCSTSILPQCAVFPASRLAMLSLIAPS